MRFEWFGGLSPALRAVVLGVSSTHQPFGALATLGQASSHHREIRMTAQSARAVPDVPYVESQTWSNWSQLATSTPAYTMTPRTEGEVAECIRFAIDNDLPVRPVGTGHSWTGLCSTNGVQIDVSALTGVRVVDRGRKLVAVKAGTTIWDLGEALWDEGFSLKNQGDIDVQTVAGALSTGTHGSGIDLGILASSVRRVRLVDGLGNVVEITEADP